MPCKSFYISLIQSQKMTISKSKCMTISIATLRCEIVIDEKIIPQMMKYCYLEVVISNFGDTETEAREQAIKPTRTT